MPFELILKFSKENSEIDWGTRPHIPLAGATEHNHILIILKHVTQNKYVLCIKLFYYFQCMKHNRGDVVLEKQEIRTLDVITFCPLPLKVTF